MKTLASAGKSFRPRFVYISAAFMVACAGDSPTDPGYRQLPGIARSASDPSEQILAVGCTSSPTDGGIGIPLVGGGVARFDCAGVSRDSIAKGIREFVAVMHSVESGAFAAGATQGVLVYLGDRHFCDRTVTRTYYQGELVSESVEWHEGTCIWRDYYIVVQVPLYYDPDWSDPWIDPNNGTGGGGNPNLPPEVVNPDSVAAEELMEQECFPSEEPRKPRHCLKKFKPAVLNLLRNSSLYLRPLEEIADTVARAECAQVRAWYDIMMSTDTILFAAPHNSPTGRLEADGSPELHHYAMTQYPDDDPISYAKAHIDPYWIKRLQQTAEPGKSFRKLTRQGYSSKLDSQAACDLGKKVRGGTRPRLRCGRAVL